MSNPIPEPVNPKKTFVLVHGAWRGGWCWRSVADRLSAAGHRVFTPTLSGLGERSHLLSDKIDLRTHIDDIVNVVQWENLRDIVLCGHSYGGFVISGVAERLAPGVIGSIAFIDAFLPENGQTLEDVLGTKVTDMPAFAQGLQRSGGLTLPAMPAAAFGVNDRDRAWVDQKCTPHPFRTVVHAIELTGARESISKKTFVRATGLENPVHRVTYERLKQDASWGLYEVACGHDIMIDEPRRLAEILIEIA